MPSSGGRRSYGDYIARCPRPESWVEETLVEMHHAGVSARHAEDITEALWRARE